MADQNSELPEGTDHIVEGAGTNTGAIATDTSGSDLNDDLMIPVTTAVTGAGGSTTGSAGTASAVLDKVRSSGEKLSGQAADKARGLVTQGIERSSEALANVSKLVGDSAAGLDERLGAEYGNYARRAAGAIEGAANSLASKDPDELIDDTRNFVRKSPGVALAGAAVIGFALARLIKSGLGSSSSAGGTSGKDRSDS